MENKELLEWRDKFTEHIQKMFLDDGYHSPMVFIMLDTKEVALIGAEFKDDREKSLFSYAVRKICKEKGAIAVMFVSEAWTAEIKNNLDTMLPPSKHPNRQEILMITFETKEVSMIIQYPIARSLEDENAKPLLAPANWMESSKGVGRFMNFLKDD